PRRPPRPCLHRIRRPRHARRGCPLRVRAHRPRRGDPMQLGIVADEISRDFPTAVRIGKSLGLLRYEIRNLTTGRAPLCDPNELLEVERLAIREQIEITALSPGLFKLTDDADAFAREMSDVYPLAA